MSFDLIEKALRGAMEAGWSGPLDLVAPNTPAPEQQAGFVLMDIHFFNSSQKDIGTGIVDRGYRTNGMIVVRIFAPKNDGVSLSAQYADDIAEIFRGQTFNGVVCFAPIVDRGREATEMGNYWLKTLTCEFYYDSY